MKKYIFFLLLALVSLAGFGQSNVDLRGDSIRIYKNGGFAELVLRNRTKDSVNAVLTNLGNGVTGFKRVLRQIDDTTYLVSGDTLHIHAASSGTVNNDNLDSVLSRGGRLSANRTTDMRAHTWTIGGSGLIQITDTTVIEHKPGIGNFIYRYVTPLNYNGSERQRFAQWTEQTAANPGDLRDDVVGSFWSYNMNPGSARIVTNEPGFAFKTETYFRADGTTLMEFHLPEFVDSTAGAHHRLKSLYVHRPDGYTYEQDEISSYSSAFSSNPNAIWLSMSSNEITGGSGEIFLDAIYGSGGLAGTQLNAPRFRMRSGTGSVVELNINGADFHLSSPTDGYITNGRTLYLNTYVQFDQGNYFGDAQVYLQSNSTASGKGFQFYTKNQGSLLFWFSLHTYAEFHKLAISPLASPSLFLF